MRDRWPSRTLFIFATVGSSVGLGNIWRFPYLVGKYGGGAFLIPYLLLMLTFGVPLLILEFAWGQKMQRGAIQAFGKLHSHFKGLGLAAIFCSFVVSCYYGVILAWSALYTYYSWNLSWGADPQAFFYNQVLQLSSGPDEVGMPSFSLLFGLVLVWVAVYFCIWKGVKSVGKVVTVTMPLPIILLFTILAKTLMLPGAYDGLRFFLQPNFSALMDPAVWMAAITQVFFSLTVGFGVMITYGSYRATHADVTKSALLTGIADVGIAFLSGLVIFSTLGYMAHEQGADLATMAASGPSLAFIVLPQAISLIPGAPFFAVLFFLTLFFLGIDSLFSLVEAIATAFSDRWPHIPKPKLVFFACLICALCGLLYTTTAGLYYLDITDHFITTYGLVLVTLFQAVVIGWIYKAETLRRWINDVSDFAIGKLWSIVICFVAPALLLLLIATQLFNDLTHPYEGYPLWALLTFGWSVLAMLIVGSILGARIWRVTESNR